jgi:hypothetical protein
MWRGLGYRSSGRLFAVSRYGHGLVGSSMRNTGAGIGKPTFLKLPCFPIIAHTGEGDHAVRRMETT